MQKITPHLWFDKEAKEAAEFYTSIFPDSKITSSSVLHNTPSGDTDVLTIELCGQEFAMISAGPVFKFTPAISFIVHCEDQKEIDYYWEKLSAVPQAEQCGWLQDKYGLSWQIVPSDWNRMLKAANPEQAARLTAAMLKMKKFDIQALKDAYEGK